MIYLLKQLASVCVYGVFFLMWAINTQADDVRPLYVDINERPASHSSQGDVYNYTLRWRIPPLVKANNFPQITLPDFCQPLGNAANQRKRGASQRLGQSLYRCEQTLPGAVVTITYPLMIPALSTVAKFAAQNGERHTQLLRPAQSQWQIPHAESKSSVARDYTRLGMLHIWAGLDHLLFVVCLLWIAGTGRRIFITITGFTLAHSITLALSALNLVRVPVPPVEASIALSIVFLAVEIVRDQRQSLTWRYPIAVSSSFGLLHGFGFAAALSEIGLPQTELVTGLLFFNVGVEIGQLIFALAAIGLMRLLSVGVQRYWQSIGSLQNQGRLLSSYAVGSLASFWLVERCMAF